MYSGKHPVDIQEIEAHEEPVVVERDRVMLIGVVMLSVVDVG